MWFKCLLLTKKADSQFAKLAINKVKDDQNEQTDDGGDNEEVGEKGRFSAHPGGV